VSYRSRHGSIGTKGFSLRTGIPGLSFRQGWGKNAGAAALILIAIMAALVMLALVVRVFAYLIPVLWQCMCWVAHMLYDLVLYGIHSCASGERAPRARREHNEEHGARQGQHEHDLLQSIPQIWGATRLGTLLELRR
jgi:fatty acid desaturase